MTLSCGCLGGSMDGTQVCQADGTYASCVCTTGDAGLDGSVAPDGATGDGGPVDADTISDGGSDVGSDVGSDGGADLDAGMPAGLWSSTRPGQICSAQGWCWVYPTMPDYVLDLASSGDGNTWAVGPHAVIHWDGTSWTGVIGASLASQVATSGRDDAWLVENGTHTIRHWDGTAWSAPTPLPTTQTIRDVWARTATDAWMVGDGATVLHWDGASWSSVTTGFEGWMNLTAVHGRGSADVWVGASAGGPGETLRHWDGAAWQPTGHVGDVIGVWESTVTDVWATGGAQQHYTGVWASAGTRGSLLTAVWGRATDGTVLFAARSLSHETQAWDGTALVSPMGPQNVAGNDASVTYDGQFVLNVGTEGMPTVAGNPTMFAGTIAALTPIGTTPAGPAWTPVVGSPVVLDEHDVLLPITGPGGGLYEGDPGGTMARLAYSCASMGPVMAARSASDIWSADALGSHHWDGTTCTAWSFAPSELHYGPSGFLGLSGNRLYRFTSSSGWTLDPAAPQLLTVALGVGTELWGADASTHGLQHFDGTAWHAVAGWTGFGAPQPPPSFVTLPWACIESTLPGQVRIVGADDSSFDGTNWTHSAPVGISTCALHNGRGWAVGPAGWSYFDGSAWQPSPALTRNVAQRIVSTPGGRMWASSPDFGYLLEYRGSL